MLQKLQISMCQIKKKTCRNQEHLFLIVRWVVFYLLNHLLSELYWFCYWFIAVSIPVLPFTLTVQFLAVHSIAPELCFVPLFARIHRSAKIVLYISVELFKRISLGIIVRYKYCPSRYAYFYTACLACCSLHIQWLVFRIILLSGDVETNPGPETLDFCTWNLNSIIAHDFL